MSGWIDAHAHVFERGLPLTSGARYAPDYDATLDGYLAHLDAHGFVRGVLVQPSFLGTDNGYLLETLRRAPERLRGIAVVDPHLAPDRLDALAASGIVGLRINLIGQAFSPSDAKLWRKVLERAAALGFQVEVQSEARRLPEVLPRLLAAGLPAVVVDHFGLPDPDLGDADPGWRWLVDLASREPRLWLKLSAPYRLGQRGLALAAMLAPILREAFTPRRLVVGSDWPHTRFESAARTGDTMRALPTWLPDRSERLASLEEAPRRLFGFGNPPRNAGPTGPAPTCSVFRSRATPSVHADGSMRDDL